MASIRCGNCKSTHTSAREVRACYFPTAPVSSRSVDKDNLRGAETVGVAYQPKGTVTTTKWAKDNMNTDWSGEKCVHALGLVQCGAPAMPGTKSCEQCATAGELKRAKEVAAPVVPVASAKVPKGKYALKLEDGTVKFYVVSHGREGTRWEGYTFLAAQASDEEWPIRNRVERERILREIGADVQGAMALYGVEIGKCGCCGRKLTSEWRKRGIGPVCARNHGFTF